MKIQLLFLLLVLLIGCSEQEWEVSSAEPERNVSSGEPEWKKIESERKSKIQSLIKQLADDSQEKRQAAFAELRDKYIRKRDIDEIRREIDHNANPNAKSLLMDLYLDIITEWRLPNSLWISSLYECSVSWNNEAKNMGYDLSVGYAPDNGLILRLPMKSEYSIEVINFILDLDPSMLILQDVDRESLIENSFLLALSGLKDDFKIISVKDGNYTRISIQ
jgi:hypothetical protein